MGGQLLREKKSPNGPLWAVGENIWGTGRWSAWGLGPEGEVSEERQREARGQ